MVNEIIAPVCGDGQLDSEEECDDGNLANGDGCSAACQIEADTATSTEEEIILPPPPTRGAADALGDVVINELVSDPADGEVEWIELYNKTSGEIDLTGWRLEDGSKAKTNLSGSLAASGSGKYKVIEKPAGVLNNDGDLVVLYDASGKIIDQVAYGNWDDGNLTDNAPAASDPASVARKFDGYNTFNNANDFSITVNSTKGASNIIQIEDEASAEARAGFDFSDDVFISEILPNPAGDDTKLEFIEIYNAGARDINLIGWSLSNEDNKKISLEKIATSTIIKAGEFLAFFRPKSKLVLHNDQGEIKLYEPLADKPTQIVSYKDVKEGWSYNLDMNNPPSPLYQGGNWIWSETPTPGAANVIKAVNHAPEVEFSSPGEALVGQPVRFDSSDTDDIDSDKLKYAWDFGDGFKNNLDSPEHTFFKSGIYKVSLAVSDGQATSTKEKSVKIVGSVGEVVEVLDSRLRGNDNTEAVARNDNIVINEILPNPAGADTGKEWAELKNQGLSKINLLNWRLENSNGKFKFKNDLWLDTENFYLLTNAESRLAFKNESDTISLYNNLDELIDRVEYNGALQGETYARGANGRWFWTTKLTPARENVISLTGSQTGIMNNELGIMGNADSYIAMNLEKVKDLEIGSLVKVNGTVAVEPGILGVQIFYIATSSSGIQIYNYKKDFPILKVGDYIEVSGELALTQEELRIKTKDKNDINIIEHKPAPTPLVLSSDAVSEENIGQLITITGEITSKKAYTAYLDDGNDEILVYFKKGAGLDTKDLKPGQAVAITGILSKTPTGLRLLPRYQSDIVKKDAGATDLEPQVLGETIEAKEWAVAERDRKLELFKYLLIIAGGVIIVLVGLFIRAYRHK
ncbi:MAG: lamin tail domain-containing protein [bacterium]|nr:lamin tail domain-containing protein [bacterium]